MTTAEVASDLAQAGWNRGTSTRDGFLVTRGKECVIVAWISPAWNAKTMGRMLRNYAGSLRNKGYEVTVLRSHLMVRKQQ